MKVLIVEDEKLAAERIQTLLTEYDPGIEVVAVLESIEDTVSYLSAHVQPDIMLLDIHLSDGHSFQIFRQVHYRGPVIFTTAFDNYALEAFRHFSIDYILRPVTLQALATALNKFRNIRWEMNMGADAGTLLQRPFTQSICKKRFLGKVGQRLFFIESTDIAYFQADNKIVYLIDKEGNQFIVDYTLERLEQLLDPAEFFRLNRRFIVRMSMISQVKPYYNNRLKVSLKGMGIEESGMVISRDRVAEFRAWAES